MAEYSEQRWDTEPEVWDNTDSPRAETESPEEPAAQAVDNSDAPACGDEREVAPCAWGHSSVLGAVETAFRLLTTGPEPLAVNGARLGHGLPARSIPLDELRDLLLDAATSRAAREVAWVRLVRSAQTDGAAWVVGAAGVALPGLRNVAGELARGYTGDVADLDAEVLDGFCKRLTTIDPDAGMLAARLVWAAGRAGAKLRASEWRGSSWHRPVRESMAPARPTGHQDLVLADAVAAGVLSHLEASVLGAIHVDGVHLTEVAIQLGWTYRRARYLRDQAEYRLVFYLTGHRPHELSTNFCHFRASAAL